MATGRLIHASCVAIGGSAILLRGPSGSGKSDLALRLIDGGAVLVADDQVALSVEDGCLVARAPAALAGLLEVRGIGIVRLPARASAPVVLVADLVPDGPVERMPEPEFCDLLGQSIRRLWLSPFEPSAPMKIRLVLSHNSCRLPPES